jgi:galactose oxidase
MKKWFDQKKSSGFDLRNSDRISATITNFFDSQRTYFSLPVLGFVTALTLIGCGGADNSNPSDTGSSVTTEDRAVNSDGVPTDGFYNIQRKTVSGVSPDKDSFGLCLTIFQATKDDGGQVVQFPCNNARQDNQLWRLERISNDPTSSNFKYYKIYTKLSAKVLAMAQSGTESAAAIQFTYNPNFNDQQWLIEKSNNAGFFRFKNRNSNRYLTIPNCVNKYEAQFSEPKTNPSIDNTCNEFNFNFTNSQPAQRATEGEWSELTSVPVIPVAAANLSDGKILMWAADKPTNYTYIPNPPETKFTVFNSSTGNSSAISTLNGYAAFCPGIAQLGNGQVLVNGGEPTQSASIFNASNNSWSVASSMKIGRGYNSSVTLSSGKVFTLGGSWKNNGNTFNNNPFPPGTNTGDKTGEVWDSQSWRVVKNALAENAELKHPDGDNAEDLGFRFRRDNHMWLFAVSGENVFQAGPSSQMNLYNTIGDGGITAEGNRRDPVNANSDQNSINGNAIMYDKNKILKLGGATHYDGKNGVPRDSSNTAYTISISNITNTTVRPIVKQTASLRFPRTYANSVVLPDGQVLTIGGSIKNKAFDETANTTASTSVFVSELWNPKGANGNGSWRDVAAIAVSRTYHSVALLLPDGRVLSGGGGLCQVDNPVCTTFNLNHPDVQIYSPPYLFNANGSLAQRPSITSVNVGANATGLPGVTYNSSLSVTASSGINQFVLMRFGAATHSINTDQRRIPVAATGTNGNYTLTIPNDRGSLPPGNYMLFALSSNGTPSIAKNINIQ